MLSAVPVSSVQMTVPTRVHCTRNIHVDSCTVVICIFGRHIAVPVIGVPGDTDWPHWALVCGSGVTDCIIDKQTNIGGPSLYRRWKTDKWPVFVQVCRSHGV